MKRLLLLSAAVALFAACTDSPHLSAPDPDPLVDRLIAMGFRPDMIVDRGDHFLVEGDLFFDKKELAAGELADAPRGPSPVPGPRFQYITNNTVSDYPAERTLNVYLSSTLRAFYPEWAAAVRAAMAEWNAIGGFNFTFVETTSSSLAGLITVTTYSQNTNVLASATWPRRNGDPGPSIKINVGFRLGNGPGGQPTYSSKVHNMVHELGHIIGFRHTNWYLNGEPVIDTVGANHVPGTPDQYTGDDNSVMNGGTANNEWNGFSGYDETAARTVYMSTIWPTPSLESNHLRLTWTAERGASQYDVYQRRGAFFGIDWYVGSTTETTFLDTGSDFTTAYECGGIVSESVTYYWVIARFPDGTSTNGNLVCAY